MEFMLLEVKGKDEYEHKKKAHRSEP